MMGKRDYYEVLGLPRSAADRDIKRTYRRLARRYHPDVNPGDKAAEARFKEITEAHEVLSDPQKRADYDQFGHRPAAGPGQRPGGPFAGAPFDLGEFSRGGFGGLGDLLEGVFGGRAGAGGQAPPRGEDLHYSIDIDFEQAIRGFTTEISLQRSAPCGTCGGSGARPGAGTIPCPECEGTGRVSVGAGLLGMARACGRCRRACAGRGRVPRTERVKVKIPPGVDTGSKIRLAEMGEAGPGGIAPGDLDIVTRVRPHPFFDRKGDNIHCTVPVTVTEAALGARIQVPTVDGPAEMRVPPGTSSGQVFRLRGKGVPPLRGGSRGDQYVTVKLVLPRPLNARAQELLRELARLVPEDPRRELKAWM
ncbi:MAG: J domain-containing protein [candidate division NC10 bacterium]|nr:J domain-containing protein [candidate division NC10 bacterium]